MSAQEAPLAEALPPVRQALEDVDDVFSFGYWIADRVFREWAMSEVFQGTVELEEARAEAVTLIYELHVIWNPQRCPKFSAYLLTYLPRRLHSWRRREARQARGVHRSEASGYTAHRVVSFDDHSATITQTVPGPGE